MKYCCFFFIKFIILQWKVVDQMKGNSVDDPYRPSKIGFVQILTLSVAPDISVLYHLYPLKSAWSIKKLTSCFSAIWNFRLRLSKKKKKSKSAMNKDASRNLYKNSDLEAPIITFLGHPVDFFWSKKKILVSNRLLNYFCR